MLCTLLCTLKWDSLGRQLIASTALVLVTLAFGLASGLASAQPGDANPTDSSDSLDDGAQKNGLWRVRLEHSVRHEYTPPNPLEEVTVRAPKPLSAHRRGVEAAEAQVWNTFNAVNGNDEFDVHCRYETPTGTRIPTYVCRPEFLDDATSRAARAMLAPVGMHSGIGLQQIEAGRAHYMERRLQDEIRGLATSHPELREHLEELDEALEKHEEARRRRPLD